MRFIDAVVWAKDLHGNYPALNRKGVVNVNPELVQIVSEQTERNVKIGALDTETTKVAAIVLQRKSKTPRNLLMGETSIEQILLSKTLSQCWKRFSVCKELVHIQLSNGNEVQKEETIQDKLDAISGDFWGLKKEDELDEERFALFVSIEIMLPWDTRNDIHDMKDAGKTNYKIAESCGIPEAVIDMYFDEDSGYRELSVSANTELNV